MLHGAGRFQDALTSFRQACDLNANSSVSHHNLGIVYAELSQMSAAEKSFRRAIQIDPQYIEAHCNLAGLLNWAGRSEEAIKALGHSVGIHPDPVELLADFGREGLETLVVTCPGFTADCLETLDELGHEGQQQFSATGGGELYLVPCVNDHPHWLDAMATIVRQESAGWSA